MCVGETVGGGVNHKAKAILMKWSLSAHSCTQKCIQTPTYTYKTNKHTHTQTHTHKHKQTNTCVQPYASLSGTGATDLKASIVAHLDLEVGQITQDGLVRLHTHTAPHARDKRVREKGVGWVRQHVLALSENENKNKNKPIQTSTRTLSLACNNNDNSNNNNNLNNLNNLNNNLNNKDKTKRRTGSMWDAWRKLLSAWL